MHRPLRHARTDGVRHRSSAPARARGCPQFWLRLALVCYLMPVILLVFAVGGVAIGAGHLLRFSREAVDFLSRRAPRARDLAVAIVPAVARKDGFARGRELHPKSRGLR